MSQVNYLKFIKNNIEYFPSNSLGNVDISKAISTYERSVDSNNPSVYSDNYTTAILNNKLYLFTYSNRHYYEYNDTTDTGTDLGSLPSNLEQYYGHAVTLNDIVYICFGKYFYSGDGETGTQLTNLPYSTAHMLIYNNEIYILGLMDSNSYLYKGANNSGGWVSSMPVTRPYGATVYNNLIYVTDSNYSGNQSKTYYTGNGSSGSTHTGTFTYGALYDACLVVFDNILYAIDGSTRSNAPNSAQPIYKYIPSSDSGSYINVCSNLETNKSLIEYKNSLWYFGDTTTKKTQGVLNPNKKFLKIVEV